MNAEAARLHEIERAPVELRRVALHAEVAQPKDDGVRVLIADEHDELIRLLLVSVADDVRAGFIEAEHDEVLFHFAEIQRAQELAHEVAHEAEICGMAGKFDFALHCRLKTSSVRSSLGSAFWRCCSSPRFSASTTSVVVRNGCERSRMTPERSSNSSAGSNDSVSPSV